jgi:hypothetical protein
LIKGMMRSMVVSKLKLATAAVAAIALAVIGIEKFVFTAPSRPAVPVKEPRVLALGMFGAAPPMQKPSKKTEPGSDRFVLANRLTATDRHAGAFIAVEK